MRRSHFNYAILSAQCNAASYAQFIVVFNRKCRRHLTNCCNPHCVNGNAELMRHNVQCDFLYVQRDKMHQGML